MPEYCVTTIIEAPAATVFAIMSDHSRYVDWSPARRVTVDVEGAPAPNGLGSVRVFHSGPLKTVERVVAYDPDQRLAYVLDKGMPVKDYRSDMVLTPKGSGVELRWSGSFDPVVPGTGRLLLSVFERAIVRFAAGIKDAAETEVGS